MRGLISAHRPPRIRCSRRAGWLLAVALLAATSASLTTPGQAADGPPWPPPDLAPLLRLSTPALDKPRVPLPPLPLPPSPQPAPDLPHPRLITDPTRRPSAPLGAPRALACNPLGTVLGVGSQLVECGKTRLQRGELDGAREAFQDAVDGSGNRSVVREGRYWLAETLLRLGKREDAERELSLVVGDDRGGEIGPYAAHLLGWLALERGDPGRALGLFDPLVRGSAPPELVPYAQHGRALAFYGLRRYPEARDQWTALVDRSLPRSLASEVNFWLGDTLGRLGDFKGAVARLQVFASDGSSVLIQPALLSLGWWSRAAGQPLEAVKTYRGLLSAYPDTRDEMWVRFGLVQALVDLGDLTAAREEARRLERLDARRAPVMPALFLIARAGLEGKGLPAADAAIQDLLARNLDPATRSYVLLLSAEAARLGGQATEARSRLEAAQAGAGTGAARWYAGIRLGEIELESRDFAAARAAADAVLRDSPSPDYRSAALILAAESAYRSQDYDRAVSLYARLAPDAPTPTPAGEIVFSLGWTELRRGRTAEALRAWQRFDSDLAGHPLAPQALLFGAEVAARTGDRGQATARLDRILQSFPEHDLARLAALDRGVLALGDGRASDALRDLRGLDGQPAMAPYVGPMRAARGVALAGLARPGEAQAEFRAAIGAGEEGLGHLGLGRLAFERGQWSEAAREFAAARDAGPERLAAAAQYGLAATAFAQGQKDEFRRLAVPLVDGRALDPTTGPVLLSGLAAVAAQDGQWQEARARTGQLVVKFPANPVTPATLASTGRAAAGAGEWATARDVLQVLSDRYAGTPAFDEVQLDFAQALVKAGDPREARRRLEQLINGRPTDPRVPRALLLLAQADEAGGDRPAAIQTYSRLRRDHPGAAGGDTAGLGEARLLLDDGKWDEARPLLQQALNGAQGEAAAEAAFRLGEGFRTVGQHQDAAEAYMSAAYIAPDSAWGRRALLGAGKSFTALKQTQPAAIVYRKLVAAAGVEPDLADQARQGLRDLGVN